MRRAIEGSLLMLATCALLAAATGAGCKKEAKKEEGSPATSSTLSSSRVKSSAIRIGVLTDMSGLYSDLAGRGSVVAAEMAIEELKGRVADLPIELVSADHQNKPDVGSNLARRWMDEDQVDVIVDVPTSSVALAVSELVRQKNRVFLASGPGAQELTGKQCSPNTVHWTYDTYALAHGTGLAVTRAGGSSWYFLTADYAFGQALERDTSAVVLESGGKVLGSVRHPLNAGDFSSFLMQAQASKAKVIGLANAGGDTVNAIKAAAEFDIAGRGQKLVGLLVFISDVKALGLRTAHGLNLTTAYYWDRDEATRGFAHRFADRHHGAMPTMVHAGVYAAVLHYLKAVGELHAATDGRAVVAKMKAMPTDDPAFGHGSIRKDGRKLHPMYLYEVKSEAESKAPWDFYKLVREISVEEAWKPVEKSECALLKE